MKISIGHNIQLYALVGGPSTGKTSIIEELSKAGETVIREAATDFISMQVQKGVNAPWEKKDFIFEIEKLHLEREKIALRTPAPRGRIFLDRGVLDAVGYIDYLKRRGTQEEKRINELLSSIKISNRYNAVFFILPHTENNFSLESNQVRHENSEDVAHLSQSIYQLYHSYGYNLIDVPGGKTPASRAAWILSQIQQIPVQHKIVCTDE